MEDAEVVVAVLQELAERASRAVSTLQARSRTGVGHKSDWPDVDRSGLAP